MIFIDNKYTRIYYTIINQAKSRPISTYTETHHIIPKSLGGTNKKENLVALTAREHFICHWLLTKMVESTKHKYQMTNAFSCMLYLENKFHKRYKINSRTFENIKKKISIVRSKYMSGSNNPMYKKSHSLETRKKMSESKKGKTFSLETKEKISKALKEKPKSVEHKTALKKAWERSREKRTGKNHPMVKQGGHKSSTKEKIKESILNIPNQKCIYCGKETTPGNIKRWHNDNCRFK